MKGLRHAGQVLKGTRGFHSHLQSASGLLRGSSRQLDNTSRALKPLRIVASKFLSLRDKILSWVEHGELVMDTARVKDAYSAIGLLASSDLQKLDLSNCAIKDLSPLSSLVYLRRLSLYNTNVESLSDLSSLVNLERLYLGRTNVKDISPLLHLKNLKKLYLQHTQVVKLPDLSKLDKLITLDFSHTRIRNLSPVLSLSSLQYLSFQDTEIKGISRLLKLPQLSLLTIDAKVNGRNSKGVAKLRKRRPKLVILTVRD